MILASTDDYIQVPAGEPLRVHITGLERIQDHKFESEELEWKLVIRFHLDEDIEGKGQVYTAWLRPSINPKSKMFKLLHSVYSEGIPNPLDPVDLMGRPLRIILGVGEEKAGRTRQYVEGYLKPATGQERVVTPSQTDTKDDDIMNDEEVTRLFDEASR